MTVKTIKKKQKHKGRGTVRTITKQVPNDSFFNFFSPLRGEPGRGRSGGEVRVSGRGPLGSSALGLPCLSQQEARGRAGGAALTCAQPAGRPPTLLSLECGFLCAPRHGAGGGWALGVVRDMDLGQSGGWAAASVLPSLSSKPKWDLEG